MAQAALSPGTAPNGYQGPLPEELPTPPPRWGAGAFAIHTETAARPGARRPPGGALGTAGTRARVRHSGCSLPGTQTLLGGAPDAARARRGDLAACCGMVNGMRDVCTSVIPKGYVSFGGHWKVCQNHLLTGKHVGKVVRAAHGARILPPSHWGCRMRCGISRCCRAWHAAHEHCGAATATCPTVQPQRGPGLQVLTWQILWRGPGPYRRG